MRKTELAMGSLLGLILSAAPSNLWAAQAAAEAGMVSASVAGLTSSASHKLDVSKVGSRVTQVTGTTASHRTAPRHPRAKVSPKKTVRTAAAASNATSHVSNRQGHVVSVWPPDALAQTPPQ